MIISNALIGMAMQHEYQEKHESSESLVFVQTGGIVQDALPIPDAKENTNKKNLVDISAAGSLLALQRQQQTLNLDTGMDQRSRLNLMILQAVFQAITGRALDISIPTEEQPQSQAGQQQRLLQVDATPPQVQQRLRSNVTSSLVYQRNERYEEKETLRFAAGGVIKTQDGREIQFQVSLGMSRSFVQESSESMQWGEANKIDPLVINFDGRGAELSQTRFAFDLDSDGTEEQIASLRPGSGFLALDRNGDGIINNGSELFGPNSGRGFAELAMFDEDGNQFIDEADNIYHKLRIWTINEDGSSQLVGLGDKQIGAIYLGHLTTPFQLKDANNNSLGEIANSGIYISETGSVGVIQELNLMV